LTAAAILYKWDIKAVVYYVRTVKEL